MRSEGEAFYDELIAPALSDLAQQCEKRGLGFFAVVEWEPGEWGRTITLPAQSGLGIRLANAAAQANGNVDSLILAIMKYAYEHGHSSMILYQLGVPMEPATRAALPQEDGR